MDKRAVAAAFRERLQGLLSEERGGVAAFLRDTGIDRSALSQFLDPSVDRMPRAETLRRIAEARGVTADWLLGLSNAQQGRQEVTPSVQIESAESAGGGSPFDRWRREAAGMKLRYVPSNLPDMLGIAEEEPEPPAPDSPALAGQPEKVLGGFRLGEMDVEIAMPVQTLRDLSEGSGLGAAWRRDCAVGSLLTWPPSARRRSRRSGFIFTTAVTPSPPRSPSSGGSVRQSTS